MNIGTLVWHMDYHSVWGSKPGQIFIEKTVWCAKPEVIISISEDTVTLSDGTHAKSDIGNMYFFAKEECEAAFDKPLVIDGPIITDQIDRHKVGEAFSSDYIVSCLGTQLFEGIPFEKFIPLEMVFGASEKVTLNQIKEKLYKGKPITIIHEDEEWGAMFTYGRLGAPYWILTGVTGGIPFSSQDNDSWGSRNYPSRSAKRKPA